METFKYYLRGKGELNTSNFADIVEQGVIEVEQLDEKTFVSLLALNHFIEKEFVQTGEPYSMKVMVKGYVSHLRGDKDLQPVQELYEYLDNIEIECLEIQHERYPGFVHTEAGFSDICGDLMIKDTPWFTVTIGCDKSVEKFFPGVMLQADKVRENGKVVSMELGFDPSSWEAHRIILVDDLIGGGATIRMLMDLIKGSGYDGEVYLWTAYNEGIHSQELLDRFDAYYIGTNIHAKEN
ncbi:hypothetical protein KNU84_gp029 [Bacteriophage DSS3_VP1]|uniref:Phosphoribosyltransferase domain-containing protein n=1 Tax=Bacteriophage DSS3_VP1 TaxID=2664196 RepID=A0A7S5KQA3_9CAUD|nr:hypothetical protein KNU84_gp029 [Bacteriophage DSS3_VP1]QGH74675.1 hypothetical protein DSS3VP1_00107 [Bacteriophage DSS3_VP1]